MKCLECRRELLINPRNHTQDLLSHIAACPPCRQEREQLLALEKEIDSGFDIPAPEGLQGRLLQISQHEEVSVKHRSGAFSGRIWQMAASILLVVGLMVYVGLSSQYTSNNAYALEETVINHITDELNQLHGSHDVSPDTLHTIMASINTQTRGDLGKLSYASNCQIRKNTGAHLIVNGQNGPVTVLVMPGEHIDSDIHVSSSRFDGTIYPTTYGSLAVVGEKGEYIKTIAEKMLHTIVAGSI